MLSSLDDTSLAQVTGGLGPGTGRLAGALARFATGYKFDLDVNKRVLEMGPVGSRFMALFGGLDQMKNPGYIKNGATAYFKAHPPPFNPQSLWQRLTGP